MGLNNPGGGGALPATGVVTAATSGTETVVASLLLGPLVVGSVIEVRCLGFNTVSSCTVAFNVRVGTTGTTADAAVTGPATGAGTSMNAFEAILRVASLGSSGSCGGTGHQYSDASNNVAVASATVNTTGTTYVTLTTRVTAGSGTYNINQLLIRQVS